jgi:hypothetical protein
MTEEEAAFQKEVRKGLAKSILGDEWDDLIKRNDEDALVEAVLSGLDTIVSTKRARQVRRRERWHKRYARIKGICRHIRGA